MEGPEGISVPIVLVQNILGKVELFLYERRFSADGRDAAPVIRPGNRPLGGYKILVHDLHQVGVRLPEKLQMSQNTGLPGVLVCREMQRKTYRDMVGLFTVQHRQDPLPFRHMYRPL